VTVARCRHRDGTGTTASGSVTAGASGLFGAPHHETTMIETAMPQTKPRAKRRILSW